VLVYRTAGSWWTKLGQRIRKMSVRSSVGSQGDVQHPYLADRRRVTRRIEDRTAEQVRYKNHHSHQDNNPSGDELKKAQSDSSTRYSTYSRTSPQLWPKHYTPATEIVELLHRHGSKEYDKKDEVGIMNRELRGVLSPCQL